MLSFQLHHGRKSGIWPLDPIILTKLGPLLGTGFGGTFVPPKASNVATEALLLPLN
jgi:hypothetical protein